MRHRYAEEDQEQCARSLMEETGVGETISASRSLAQKRVLCLLVVPVGQRVITTDADLSEPRSIVGLNDKD